jgi:hypothetical protein
MERAMNIGELFHSLERDKVIAALEIAYPKQVRNRAGYLRAWEEIVQLQPQSTDLVCLLKLIKADPDDPDEVDRVDVAGLHPGDDTAYAIELVPWENWLSMDVRLDGIDGATPEQVLAHVLWEMTWAGYDRKAVAKRASDLHEKIEEIEATQGDMVQAIRGLPN